LSSDRRLGPVYLRVLLAVLPALPALLALPAIIALAGCRHDMQNQNKVRPYRASTFYSDGASARPLPAHTVARGDLRADEAYYTGIRGGKPVADLPFPLSREVLLRGQQRYDIFCSPCHGRVGDGLGMIVTRGYKQPPSLHSEQLRNAQVGWFFSVMTQGFGVMPSYAAQVSESDRWAIAAYIRALQYSQSARLSELPPSAQQAIAGDLAAGSAGSAGSVGAAAAPPPGAAPSPSPGSAPPPPPPHKSEVP